MSSVGGEVFGPEVWLLPSPFNNGRRHTRTLTLLSPLTMLRFRASLPSLFDWREDGLRLRGWHGGGGYQFNACRAESTDLEFLQHCSCASCRGNGIFNPPTKMTPVSPSNRHDEAFLSISITTCVPRFVHL